MANDALGYIKALYDVERAYTDKPSDERLKARQEKSYSNEKTSRPQACTKSDYLPKTKTETGWGKPAIISCWQ